MPQTLEDKLYQEYRIRASESLKGNSELAGRTEPLELEPSQPQAPPRKSIWDTADTGEYPDWYERASDEAPESNMLNAVGVGLWSAFDTGFFGVPGALVSEEEFLDFEDPMAKWTGAVGGFAGFVAGAPMKIGARLVREATGLIAPKLVNKQGLSTVISKMREKGLQDGLSKKSIKKATKGYEKLVHKAQIDETLQGDMFGRKVMQYTDEYIARASMGPKPIIKSPEEAAAIRDMFLKEGLRRPLQDFKGLALARHGNTKYARWLGHAINDVVMFSFIDSVFEGVSTVEDHHFDFTAPLWGAVNGLAFSSLSLLNPKGKASSWFSDYKVGVRAAFGAKSIFGKMEKNELAKHVRFMGESLANNSAKIDKSGKIKQSMETVTEKITYKGKTREVRLNPMGGSWPTEDGARKTLLEFESKFGDDAEKVMRIWLEGQRKKWGREIMRYANAEEAKNLFQVWPRMVMGGLLFNAHSFYDMFAHDQEYGIHDILPHFLIGAYLQRHSNPAKFDLDSVHMNKVRENLAILGFRPDQLSFIPSLMMPENEFRNPLNREKYRSLIELAESEGIISDNPEIISRKLETGVESIGTPQNKNASFESIYTMLYGKRAMIKPIDAISVESAKKIVNEFKKIEPGTDLTSEISLDKLRDRESEKMTEAFEKNFEGIINSLEGDLELKITKNKDGDLRVPEIIMESEALRDKARKGELDWLRDESGVVMSGDEAVQALVKKFDGLNSITTASSLLGQSKLNSKEQGQTVEVKSEETARKIFERISTEEKQINNIFGSRSNHVENFSFAGSFNDYIHVLTRNHAIKFTRDAIEIFKPEYGNKSDLISYLKDAGILQIEPGTSKALIVDDVNKIEITGVEAEKAGELKRFLGRVLTLQSVVGNYEGTERRSRVSANDVENLKRKLSELGYNEEKIPMWLTKNMVDYAVREKIRDTELTLADVDSIFRLSTLEMAKVGVEVGKKAAGFRIRLIDENFVDESGLLFNKSDAVQYNNEIRQMVNKSNGLITIEADKAKILDPLLFNQLKEALPKVDAENSESASAKLGDFLNLIADSSVPGSARFREQLGRFIEEGGAKGHQRAITWLTESGVLKLSEATRQWNVDIESYNELIRQRIQSKINWFGITPEYAERVYESIDRNARDRAMIDTADINFVKNITLQEFFDRYRIDGVDNSKDEMITKQETIDSLVFENKDGRLLTPDSVNKILSRIHVKNAAGTDWVKYEDQSFAFKNANKYAIVRDLVGLLGSRRGQRKLEKIQWKNGRISKDKEHVQYNRHEAFFDALGIEYMLFDSNASFYMMSPDGRRITRKTVDIFGDTSNLSEYNRKQIQSVRDKFEREANIIIEVEGESIIGESGEVGLAAMRIAPNMNPIVIKVADLKKIKEPFDAFAAEYLAEDSRLNQQVKNRIREIRDSLQLAEDRGTPAVNIDYESAIRRLMLKDMLTGSDGNELFVQFMNGEIAGGIDKLFARSKLYSTKKFIRFNKDFVLDVADTYGAIGDKETSRVLRDRLKKDGWGVSVWNDKQRANVKEEVDALVKDLKIDWNWVDYMGDAHRDVSSFDSIAFVSKDVLRFNHAMAGHDPRSFNPMKPVISSGGENSPLLLGKTLFVYSPNFETFFANNRGVDILLTKTGAKALNPIKRNDVSDVTLINDANWNELPNYRVNNEQIRRLEFESIGIKPEKDAARLNAKNSPADHNFFNNEESGKVFGDDISASLNKSIRNVQSISSDPIGIRRWILEKFGDDALTSSIDGTDSMSHLNGMFYFAGLTRDANPMSYSDSIVKNKMFNAYIDKIINGRRSVTNQFAEETSHRYGGQAVMIQAPIMASHDKARLRPTLVDSNGNVKSRGEVLLPYHESKMGLSELISSGREVRVVDDGKVYTLKEIYKELYGEKLGAESLEYLMDSNPNLGDLHLLMNEAGKEFSRPNLQLGIIVRRNPRTRPNDLALMGLKGFLQKEYGNSLMINSLDVVNIFEGDYDADKADYFFAERANTYNHIQRVGHYFVQGQDPTGMMKQSKFNWGMNGTSEKEMVEKMSADLDLFKKSIGFVQPIPRMLTFMGNVANNVSSFRDPSMKSLIRKNKKGEEVAPKILYQGRDRDGREFRVVIDYENSDFFARQVLETQMIIDGKGDLNGEIANNISNWRNRFLFPSVAESILPGEISNYGDVGFVNNFSRDGASQNKRVRIFRRLVKDKESGEYQEIGDLSNLDRAILTEMMNEYGNLLRATGDTFYEKSGEGRRMEYEDVMDASERFFNFNKDMRKSLYYRLRRRRQDITDEKSPRWYDSNEFKALFGVKANSKEVNGVMKTWWTTENEAMFDETVKLNSQRISKGEAGSPTERILFQLYDANLFKETRSELLTGDARKLMDDWYSELMGDPAVENRQGTERFEVLTDKIKKSNAIVDQVKGVKFDVDHRINLIADLKRKVVQIKRNKNQPWKIRQQSIEKLNNLIREVENEIRPWLTEEYKKTRSAKDLKRIQFVDVDAENMKRGTIYYATMEQMKRSMPLIGASDKWGLSPKGIEDLNQLKNIRRIFYSNRDNLGQILKHGAKKLLSPAEFELLEKFPEANTHYDIENQLLFQGVSNHGLKFLWAFMQPVNNKYNIGVFDGKPISVPFEAKEGIDPASRYKRGMNFLTKLALGNVDYSRWGNVQADVDLFGNQLGMSQDIAKRTLKILQSTEAHFNRYFNRRFDLKLLTGENIAETFEYKAPENLTMVYNSIRLPNFHKDMERSFVDFGSIKWNREGNRIRNGFGLLNDHLFDFYRDIMKIAGKESDFDSYLNKMNKLQDAMMSNEIINPLQYMSARSNLEAEVKGIAEQVLTYGLKEGSGRMEKTSKIIGSPIWAIMGGTSHFKGLKEGMALEKASKLSLDGLGKMSEMSRQIEKVKLDMPFDETSEQKIRRLKDELVEIEKCY